MARDGQLPRALAYVDPKRKVPERAVFLITGITLLLSLWMINQLELLTSIKRAGANQIITYHAKDAARWLREEYGFAAAHRPLIAASAD